MSAFMMLLAAVFVGSDAATKLNRPHPLPVAWFEAAVTFILILGAVILIAVGRSDDE